MSKRLLIAAFAAAVMITGPSLNAQELTGYDDILDFEDYSYLYEADFYQSGPVDGNTAIYSIQDGQGLAYRLARSSEGATLGFFVKADKSEHAIYDPSAEELNAIAPAAGIQLTFDFNL